jgi:hypothetical protein
VFAGSDNAVRVECSLDGDPFGSCASPLTLTVVDGIYDFAVRAADEAGNVDPSPAMHVWTIDATAPETMITNVAVASGATSGPSVTFGTPDVTATFECSMAGAQFVACTSPRA